MLGWSLRLADIPHAALWPVHAEAVRADVLVQLVTVRAIVVHQAELVFHLLERHTLGFGITLSTQTSCPTIATQKMLNAAPRRDARRSAGRRTR